ncbi:biopolymer transporter ExbB [Tabrizicola sp. TH137]|uniref:biopolymer transporter ExbB n=1 Tax=Tabrizicola sp. TH137 TaxID=2067452 RepID=UPI000C7D0743|nr:biopolymer transporter ExbB [Tabrizicola sp. TH137]PLL14129.1 biopolymer transporter ExbB [Tabrizicola sp. TH137]
MDKQRGEASPTFSQPIRQIVMMLLVAGMVGSGAWLIHTQVAGIFQSNPLVNGFIAGVFLLGVITCFWQVFILVQSVSWIEDFVRHVPGHDATKPPRLLAPLASLLRSRGAKMQISASSSRSILESVATRIDEARDITRYLANLLVFLGLLGTFYGLATTVPAVVETIRSLAPQEGETGLQIFEKLLGGLESQLGGMGTAFSSSLLGLAGSLVIGLLELFAGHGQNRFYRELEEWLSSITRVGLSSGEGEGSDTGAMAAVLDQVQAQMDALQSLYTQSDITRVMVEDKIDDLARAIARLSERRDDGPGDAALLAALTRIAEGQERLTAAVLGGGEAGAMGSDAESRMRLRSIDVQLLKILEEMSAGRQESLADLRGDIAALTAAIRQLSRSAPAGRG